jgi:hypothetical protein
VCGGIRYTAGIRFGDLLHHDRRMWLTPPALAHDFVPFFSQMNLN